MAAFRGVLGTIILLVAALNSLIARTVETCTQNSPDSLYGGIITLGFNLVGFLVIGWQLRVRWLLIATVVPSIVAAQYTYFALWFAHGYMFQNLAACEVIARGGMWVPSGDEPAIARIWIGAALSFWMPLAIAYWKALHYRPVDEPRYAP
jgi:hypothetical protein